MLAQDHVTTSFSPPSSHLYSSTLNFPSAFDVEILPPTDGFDFSDVFWMSAHPHAQSPHEPPAHWMQANRSYPQQPQQHQQVSAQSDYYSYPHQHTANTREWPSVYSDAFSPFAVTQTSPQTKFRAHHRRALSNSTINSQASTSSPQQPAPLYHQHGLLTQSHSGPHFNPHYYPTPTHTPTQDSFMDRGYNRRNIQQNTSAPAQGVQGKQGLSQLRTSGPQYTSAYGQEYPATPSTANGDQTDRRYNAPQYAEHPSMPRLEHSMTQVMADELYHPTLGAGPTNYPAPQPRIDQHLLRPGDVQERINAARASKSPVEAREPSPYAAGSPMRQSFAQDPQPNIRTSMQDRQMRKITDDEHQRWRHLHRGEEIHQQLKTISPKEAYLDDFRDPAEEAVASTPLFPTAATSSSQAAFDENAYRSAYGSVNAAGHFPPSTFSFQQPSIPASATVHPGGDFKFAPLRHNSSSDDTPAHLISMDTSKSEPDSSQDTSLPPPQPQHRPIPGRRLNTISTADTGTYTCTYQGCPQRFATPALLQKHKREAHRATGGPGAMSSRPATQSPHPGEGRSGSASPDSTLNRNSQAGPHRCDRINPSTGKPCNTIFSRPYDLTRHEDTIHARRAKVHCQYCAERGEEKTFSRADALTRHLRVVHPEVGVYGRGGRRRGP